MRGSVPYGVRQGFDSVNLMNHMNVKRTFFSKKGKQAKAETEEDKKKDEEDAAAAEQAAENEDAKKDSKKSSDEAESSTEQKAEEAGDDKQKKKDESGSSSGDEQSSSEEVDLTPEDVKKIRDLIKEQDQTIEDLEAKLAKFEKTEKELKQKLVYQMAENDNTVKRYRK